MSNPVLTRSPMFSDTYNAPVVQAYPAAGAGYGAPAASQGQYAQPPTPDQLSAAYGGRAAGPAQTGRMTYDDVMVKTAGVFGVLLVGATIGWMVLPKAPGLLALCVIAAIVLGLICSFKKEPSPALITTYAAVEGVFVGGVSAIFNYMWDGVVLQAVLATLAVFGVTLALFASGKVRASARATKIFLVVLTGYFVFSLINLGLMLTNTVQDPWGLRGSVTIFGMPLGVVLGVVVIFLAAYSFVIDFDFAQRGVRNGIPAKYAWTVAFSILVDIVWLYLEILRLLAILRSN